MKRKLRTVSYHMHDTGWCAGVHKKGYTKTMHIPRTTCTTEVVGVQVQVQVHTKTKLKLTMANSSIASLEIEDDV